MATVAAPAQNIYFTRDPAQIAQEKYSSQTWNERYAYITMVAFTALAIVANIFLAPSALPLTLLAFNVGVLSAASNLVLPFVLGWFEEAKKFKAQGDKETAIAAKLQELRAMQPDAIIEQFTNLDVTIRNLPSSSLQQAPELALLARVIYRDKQAEDFTAAAARLKTENKFRESLQAEESAAKAAAKAAFFSSLIDKPTRAGKFKEHFAWVDQTIEERAFRNIYRDAVGDRLVQTRGPSPQFLNIQDTKRETAGDLGRQMNRMLTPAPSVAV
ncbi:MAG TPA: hypothetical protein VIJ46_06970 [Rhabdochlamydiaceae bacterium]